MSAPAGPVRTVFLGSGDFAVPILEALVATPVVTLVGVVTTPARPAGRDGALRATPVAQRAGSLGIVPLTPDRLRDPAALAAIASLAPDLLVLADYGRIVPAAILDLPPHRALNLHPSLLPRHRGATPIPAAILAGDRETGVTLMRMDEGVDTGPIVAVRHVPLVGDERAPALEAVLAREAASLLVATLPGWLAGTVAERPQPSDGATHTRPLVRQDAWLDPGAGATALERRIRAFDPWPGAWLEGPGGRLIVHAAHVLSLTDREPPDAAPGSVIALGPDVTYVTADGLLVLDEVQPSGKRRMPGRDYRRGLRPA